MPNDNSMLEVLNLIGTFATPIMLVIFSGIGWWIKGRMEASQKVEEQLRIRAAKLEEAIRNDRLEIYNAILEPFTIIFSKEDVLPAKRNAQHKTNEQRATEIILSAKYRQAGFRLMLFANDGVAKAYNNLMYSCYHPSSTNEEQGPLDLRTQQIISAFGKFLLEIRKSVGNESTSLTNLEMMTWMISDSEKLRSFDSESPR